MARVSHLAVGMQLYSSDACSDAVVIHVGTLWLDMAGMTWHGWLSLRVHPSTTYLGAFPFSANGCLACMAARCEPQRMGAGAGRGALAVQHTCAAPAL